MDEQAVVGHFVAMLLAHSSQNVVDGGVLFTVD